MVDCDITEVASIHEAVFPRQSLSEDWGGVV